MQRFVVVTRFNYNTRVLYLFDKLTSKTNMEQEMSDAKQPIENNESTNTSPLAANDSGDKKAELLELFKKIHGFTEPLSRNFEVIKDTLNSLHEHNESALTSLIDLHKIAFKMNKARGTELVDPTDSCKTFLDAITAELENYVQIIIPQPDDSLDLKSMKCIGRDVTDRPFDNDKVITIEQCGYQGNTPAGRKVFSKAWVTAYKCESVGAFERSRAIPIADIELAEKTDLQDADLPQDASHWKDFASRKDIVLVGVLIFALLLGVVVVKSVIDSSGLFKEVKTVSELVYKNEYSQAIVEIDGYEDWGDLKQWSKDTRDYCNRMKESDVGSKDSIAGNKSKEKTTPDQPGSQPSTTVANESDVGKDNAANNSTDSEAENVKGAEVADPRQEDTEE